MKYLFNTITTMKEYNREKWWIDSDIIKPIEIIAGTISEALNKYAEHVKNTCIDVSKTAIKNKAGMYRDTPEGTKQIGYVMTGSMLFQNDDYTWTKQYIDLWIQIDTIIDTMF